MSGEEPAPGNELDNCSEWILQNNHSFQNTGVPQHLEIEWLETCIGHQRLVLQIQVSTRTDTGTHRQFTDCLL